MCTVGVGLHIKIRISVYDCCRLYAPLFFGVRYKVRDNFQLSILGG